MGVLAMYVFAVLRDADAPRLPHFSGELDTGTIAEVIRLLAARLGDHHEELNRLNVFPVPDGDTGDNLVATLGTVVEHLSPSGDRNVLIDAIARGALLGGRGSSGVILGQALRGFVKSLPDPCGAEGLAAALHAAATSAWSAIADPAEGTILTVARDAARQAGLAASSGTPADVAREAAEEGRRSLARTPELLPALARAGVVDAGGLGYVLFLDALAEALAGLRSGPIEVSAHVDQAAAGREPRIAPNSGGRYELLCLLDAEGDAIAALRQQWLALGDTVAIAGDARTWRGHVHTNDVGAALAAAQDAGDISEVEITDLAEQAAGERGLRAAGEADGEPAIVAVADGDGLVAGYLEAGAHRVVVGGLSSKPSTGELLRVIETCHGPVVLLAGDTDVVPAAERAAELSSVPARVVRAVMLAGLMALEVVCAELGDVSGAQLGEVARSIRTLRVQRAVRGARTDLGEVRAGDWLAMGDEGPVAIGRTSQEALVAAVEVIVTPAATSALLALDVEAPSDYDAVAALREAHPQVRWRVVRSNRPACAYGVALR